MSKHNSPFQNTYFKTDFQLPVEVQQTAIEMFIKEKWKNKANSKLKHMKHVIFSKLKS